MLESIEFPRSFTHLSSYSNVTMSRRFKCNGETDFEKTREYAKQTQAEYTCNFARVRTNYVLILLPLSPPSPASYFLHIKRIVYSSGLTTLVKIVFKVDPLIRCWSPKLKPNIKPDFVLRTAAQTFTSVSYKALLLGNHSQWYMKKQGAGYRRPSKKACRLYKLIRRGAPASNA